MEDALELLLQLREACRTAVVGLYRHTAAVRQLKIQLVALAAVCDLALGLRAIKAVPIQRTVADDDLLHIPQDRWVIHMMQPGFFSFQNLAAALQIRRSLYLLL